MSQPMVMTLLACLAAGAALLELLRLPPRRRPARRGARRVAGDAPAPARARWSAGSEGGHRTERLLDAGGRVEVPTADALAARQRAGGVVGMVWGGAIGALLLPGPLALAVAAGGGAAGRMLPVFLLRRAGHARVLALRDETPEFLELLAVALGCGLPLRAALHAASEWTTGELSSGAARAALELTRGAGTSPTLDRLVREHPTAELEAAVAVLDRSRDHGTPAAAPLRALATSARHARARRAMEHAARAAPRVQLVAALLLVPAALCVLAAALVAGGLG